MIDQLACAMTGGRPPLGLCNRLINALWNAPTTGERVSDLHVSRVCSLTSQLSGRMVIPFFAMRHAPA